MKVNKGHIIPPARCNQFGSTNRVHGFLAHDFAWLPSEGRGAYVRKQCVTGMPPMRSRNWGLQPKPAALFAGEERPGFHPNYRFYETIIHRNIKKTGDDQLVGGSKSTNQTNLINVQNKQWSPHEKGKQQLESKSFETPTTNICRLQTLCWITRVCLKKIVWSGGSWHGHGSTHLPCTNNSQLLSDTWKCSSSYKYKWTVMKSHYRVLSYKML